MKTFRSFAFFTVLVAPLASQAQTSLGLANSFNGFIFGNALFGGNESEGPVAVGGNYTTDGAHNIDVFHINGPTIGAKTNVSLYVKGDLNVVGGQLEHGNAYVGGNFTNTSGPFNLNGGSTLRVGGTIANGAVQNNAGIGGLGAGLVDGTVFTNQKSFSQSQSSLITGLGTTYGNSIVVHTPVNQNDQNKFEAKNHAGTVVGLGDQNSLNIDVSQYSPVAGLGGLSVYVFNVASSLVGNAGYSSLNLNFNNISATSTVLVNVTGGGVLDWKIKNNASNFGRILYNFGTATQVSIGSNDEFKGSILAPYAKVISTKRVNGNLIANEASFSDTELHFGNNAAYKFVGYAPQPQAVPEPGTLAVLGLGAAALLRRRRRA